MILETLQSATEKLYRNQVTYFDRPVLSNTPYPYDLMNVIDPDNFQVKIKDKLTVEYETKLKTLLKAYAERIASMSEKEDFPSNLFYRRMPVVVKQEDESCPISRGELLQLEGTTAKVSLIDIGKTLETTVDKLHTVTVDILRVPKVGFRCKLSQLIPEGSEKWSEAVCKEEHYVGKNSQVVIFTDYYPVANVYETTLEVDRINIAVKFCHLGLAKPINLPVIKSEEEEEEIFPSLNYSLWIGLKLVCFGVTLFQENGKIKCVLQLQPDEVLKIQDDITEYVNALSDSEKLTPKIIPGVCCLAKYGGGEYFRAVIIQGLEGGNVEIEYVDYKEVAQVPVTDLLRIPEKYLGKPVGAVVCQITDIIQLGDEKVDFEKLKAMVYEKDLYAVIDACDPEYFGDELLVSLFQPAPEFNGSDQSFAEILGIKNKPMMKHDILQYINIATKEVGRVFLRPTYPDETRFYPGVKTLVSYVFDWDSIWIQMDDESIIPDQISEELGLFYTHGGCDFESRTKFLEKLGEGDFIATCQPDEEGIDVWYRGKVLEIDVEKQSAKVLFLDSGYLDWIPIKDLYPLHTYFLKDAIMTYEIAFKPFLD